MCRCSFDLLTMRWHCLYSTVIFLRVKNYDFWPKSTLLLIENILRTSLRNGILKMLEIAGVMLTAVFKSRATRKVDLEF